MSRIISYAQNREDVIIDAFFDAKSTGYYVDIGAGHPTKDSVTNLFYKKGWRGINIEPNPSLIEALKAARPADINLNIAVAAKAGHKTLRIFKGAEGLSAIKDAAEADSEDYEELKRSYRDVSVQALPLSEVLADNAKQPIDFMKIDVEGYEYEVIASHNWEAFRPELICIESNHVRKDWATKLTKAGYVQFFNDGLNDYYALANSGRLKEFSFPDKVLMRHQILSYTPHYELLNNDSSLDFDSRQVKKKKQIAASLRIRWSLIALRESLFDYLISEIISIKRSSLIHSSEKITGLRPISPTPKPKYGAIRLFILKVALLGISVINKLEGIVRRVRHG